ncbi:MAG: hypothetical protein ACM3NQ_04695 [Bacteroidales bacterium]
MRYLNRWSMSCMWVAAMIVAWFALVPGELSVSTWFVITLAGPILFVGAGTFWESGRPTPSFGQSQASQAAPDVPKAPAAGRRQ